MRRYVIVSGLPAAGKSTVAAAISRASTLPLFDKDAYLEASFATAVPSNPAVRTALSRSADESMRGAVEASHGGVVASWWKHPDSDDDSGTPTDWLRDLPGQVFEVYCRCPPELAAHRFMQRVRHPGHFDNRRSPCELNHQFERAARRGPLGLHRCIELDTSVSVAPDAVWPRIEQAFREESLDHPKRPRGASPAETFDPVNMRFCRALGSRLAQINDLIRRSKSHWPWPAEYLQSALPLHVLSAGYLEKNFCVEARDGRDALVAFGSLVGEPPVLVLDNFWVDPEVIGRGIGRQMFRFLRQSATDRGASAIRVLPDPPAEGFYRRMGFADTGDRVTSRVPKGPVFSVYRLLL